MVFGKCEIALPSLPRNPLNIRNIGHLEGASQSSALEHAVGHTLGHPALNWPKRNP